MPKQTFANAFESVITNETTQDLIGLSFPNNVLVCYDRIAVVNYTSVPTLLSVGFKAGARELLIESFITTLAGEVRSVLGRIFLPATYRPFARFDGANSGDKVALMIYGYLTDMEK